MATETKESIAEAIVRLRDDWVAECGYACPCEINGGDCLTFADEVSKLFQGAYAAWGHTVDPDLVDGSEHCVIVYKGRFYDSQCPEGVDKIEDIPFWAREDFCTCDL